MLQEQLVPAIGTAETRQAPAPPWPTTVCDAPAERRRCFSRLPGHYGDTTNCVLSINVALTSAVPTLGTELFSEIVREQSSVADIVAEVVESDLQPSARLTSPACARPYSLAMCIALAREIAPLIHGIRDLRYAAFRDDEEQTASLMIHCSSTRRQIMVEFDAIGRATCSKIDEHMQYVAFHLEVGGMDKWRELVAWLRRRG